MIQIVDKTQLSANKESSCLDSIQAHDAFILLENIKQEKVKMGI